MKKLVTIATILVLVGLVVANKNNVKKFFKSNMNLSCCSLSSDNSLEGKIKDLEKEIAELDSDLPKLIHQAAKLEKEELEPLREKVNKSQDEKAALQEKLIDFAEAIKANTGPQFVYAKETFTPSQAKAKLAKQYSHYNFLKNQEKLLAETEKHKSILMEKVTKISQTKQDFQIKLTQLKTELAVLRTQSSGPASDPENNQHAKIQKALEDLELEISVLGEEQRIWQEITPSASGSQANSAPQIDPDVVLNALKNNAGEDNVQTVKTQK